MRRQQCQNIIGFVFGGETLVRSVWWSLLLAYGSSQAVMAAAPPAGAIDVQAAGDLQISSKLRTHVLEEDQMSAFLIADDIHSDEDGRVVLEGNAEVRRIDSVIKGDRIDYMRSTGQLRVRGNGLLMRDASIVKSPAIDYNIDAETGELSEPDFWLGATGGAGSAERADIFSTDHMRLTQVTYTGCPCPEPAWFIKSRQVDLHFEANEGIARHGTLYFKNVPILYSPYLSFPIRKERKSGFLIPTYGTSTAGGIEFSAPYYFNLAPNYDLTLTPRIMAKRGVQLGAEFRYLGERYGGEMQGTYLHDDRQARRDRWYYGWRHNHALGGGLHASFDIRRVSDDDYFRDFSSLGLNEATNTWLPSTAALSWWNSPYVGGSLSVHKYQTLQDRTSTYLTPQYDKLPELYVRAARYDWGGFDVVSENYATRFVMPFYSGSLSEFDYYRDHRIAPNGNRFSSYTSVAYPIVRAGWYVTPKVGVHLSQYSVDWFEDELTQYRGFNRTQSRALPILSLDSGMTFERDTSLFGNAAVQTLEPRLYYLYVPYRDQTEIPVFDTAYADFSFSQAFSENVFSGGWDRIADANQLTMGLTSRWLDADSGFERLSLSVAQRIYFRDQRVTLWPHEQGRTRSKSDYLLGANAALTDTLSVRFDAQFNPDSRDRNRMTAGVRWEPKRLASLSAWYRYQRDPRQVYDPTLQVRSEDDQGREQATIAGQWPLSKNWYALGRYDYSIKESRSTQAILGLEYKGDCCWAARVVLQRYAVARDEANTAVFFQLELAGLGGIGSDPMGMVSERISGYQTITPPIPEKTVFERYQ